MTAHLPILIVLCPLAAALAVPLVARASARAARALTMLASLASLTCAIARKRPRRLRGCLLRKSVTSFALL